MGYFAKYRPQYKQPERFTPAEARERRLAALLERESRFQQVPNFQSKIEATRSLAAKERAQFISGVSPVNDRQARGHKAASIAAALASFKEADFADAAKRKQYRLLRQAQLGPQNVRPTGTDRRQFNPTGLDAYTKYGTPAKSAVFAFRLPNVENPLSVFPCIQRSVRRQVMFALGFGGRGYKKPKRRTSTSGIPC